MLFSASKTIHHIFFVSLTPYFPETMGSPIHQNYSTRLNATINHLHLQASYAYLCLGLYFNQDKVVLDGMAEE